MINRREPCLMNNAKCPIAMVLKREGTGQQNLVVTRVAIRATLTVLVKC